MVIWDVKSDLYLEGKAIVSQPSTGVQVLWRLIAMSNIAACIENIWSLQFDKNSVDPVSYMVLENWEGRTGCIVASDILDQCDQFCNLCEKEEAIGDEEDMEGGVEDVVLGGRGGEDDVAKAGEDEAEQSEHVKNQQEEVHLFFTWFELI